MIRILLVIAAFLLVNCQRENMRLFDDINEMANFDRVYQPSLIQQGKENGFLEPLMQFAIYKIDSTSFERLERFIISSKKFKQGHYYLNLELDDFLQDNDLKILNMSKSLIAKNPYYEIYYFYLLSDRKTFIICQVDS